MNNNISSSGGNNLMMDYMHTLGACSPSSYNMNVDVDVGRVSEVIKIPTASILVNKDNSSNDGGSDESVSSDEDQVNNIDHVNDNDNVE